MFHENTSAFTFQTDQECICVCRSNRRLMRPGDERRLWWPANKKRRGAFCGPATGVLKRFFRRREESPEKKRDLDGGGQRLELKEWKVPERRLRWRTRKHERR
ncbi:hypothetical protein TNCV_2166791 [Trichonephila clavipes]|nr:hypothetical protein TNCV_2166791 [Trichonephila clavipes]